MQYNNISSTKINKQHQNTIMENRNENNYEKDDEHELSPLLLVPIDAAPTTKKSPGSKRFVALLLVSATAAAAAMTVLLYCSLITGVNPIVFPAVSSVFGTGRAKQQGEWCAGFWYAACDDNLSCFMSENSNYCVPNGQKNACCGSSWADVAAGIDCGPGLSCDSRLHRNKVPVVSTCHPTGEDWSQAPGYFAVTGSCNVNTGEPANILKEYTFT